MTAKQAADKKQNLRRGAIAAVIAIAFIGAGYGVYRFISSAGSGANRHVMEVVTLKLIQPPPPPPPPPVQRPPEPPKMLAQPLDQRPQDKPKAADKPPLPLALDAKAGPGSDSFGLGGRPGGSDLIGSNSGGGGSRFGWYANIVQDQILRALQKDDKLRISQYRITVSVWLSSTGRPDRVKLINSTGNAEVDSRIEQTLAAMPSLPDAPPKDMPQPVNLRIDARAAQ